MPISPEGEEVLSVGGPGGPIPASAETGSFNYGALYAQNYGLASSGGAYNSLSAYYGYGYNSYIGGVAGASPFFASFSISTGYGGGPVGLGDEAVPEGFNTSGSYIDTGSGLGGGPTLEALDPGWQNAVPDSLIFNPGAAPTSPGFVPISPSPSLFGPDSPALRPTLAGFSLGPMPNVKQLFGYIFGPLWSDFSVPPPVSTAMSLDDYQEGMLNYFGEAPTNFQGSGYNSPAYVGYTPEMFDPGVGISTWMNPTLMSDLRPPEQPNIKGLLFSQVVIWGWEAAGLMWFVP